MENPLETDPGIPLVIDPVYQEQTSDPHLAPKVQYIGRTMLAVEALKDGQ